jgi:hypothetical protein
VLLFGMIDLRDPQGVVIKRVDVISGGLSESPT